MGQYRVDAYANVGGWLKDIEDTIVELMEQDQNSIDTALRSVIRAEQYKLEYARAFKQDRPDGVIATFIRNIAIELIQYGDLSNIIVTETKLPEGFPHPELLLGYVQTMLDATKTARRILDERWPVVECLADHLMTIKKMRGPELDTWFARERMTR